MMESSKMCCPVENATAGGDSMKINFSSPPPSATMKISVPSFAKPSPLASRRRCFTTYATSPDPKSRKSKRSAKRTTKTSSWPWTTSDLSSPMLIPSNHHSLIPTSNYSPSPGLFSRRLTPSWRLETLART